jgi:tetratricopeptide (TPR) repeat protein
MTNSRLWAVGLISFCLVSCADRKPPLVALPPLDLAKFLPAVKARIEPAYTAATANPDNPDLVGKLGMLLAAHDQLDAAGACYERAHGLDPKSFRWTYYLGLARAAQGKTAQAITILRESLRLDPGYVPARLKLAEVLLAENQFVESEKEYQKVLTSKPGSATAHYGLARVYSQNAETAKSLDEYRKAAELFPAYGAANYALALIYRKQGQAKESTQHFNKYERNKTTSPAEDDPLQREVSDLNAGAMSHLHRAAVLEQSGKIAEAVAEHEKALEIDPKLVQAHVNLISLYGRLGRLEKAEEFYQSAVALDPTQADAYYNHGVLLFNRDRSVEAEKEFREALRINPYHAQAHHNLGFLNEQKGNLSRALEQYELAASSQASYPLAHFHAGRILASQKKYDRAIAHLLKAVHPEDERTPAYLYALAATYARSGNRVGAIKFARLARTGAASFGQTELLASIDKDIATLERK